GRRRAGRAGGRARGGLPRGGERHLGRRTPVTDRPSSTAGRLARLGFADPGRAQRLLVDPALAGLVDPLEDVFDGLVRALGEVPGVSRDVADLAAAALEAALAIARAELPDGSEPCRITVLGMGKCGGRELNYVSDVDVVHVAEPVEGGDEQAALATGARLAAA